MPTSSNNIAMNIHATSTSLYKYKLIIQKQFAHKVLFNLIELFTNCKFILIMVGEKGGIVVCSLKCAAHNGIGQQLWYTHTHTHSEPAIQHYNNKWGELTQCMKSELAQKGL